MPQVDSALAEDLARLAHVTGGSGPSNWSPDPKSGLPHVSREWDMGNSTNDPPIGNPD